MATQAPRPQPGAQGQTQPPRVGPEPLIYCEIYGAKTTAIYPNEHVELLEVREPEAGRPLMLTCMETRTGKKFTVSTTLPFLLIRNLTPAQVYLQHS
jgi:hypothetical protein